MRLIVITMSVAVALPPATGDATRRNEPFLSLQWNLSMIEAPAAWKHSQGRGVTIAVVDQGVDWTHPELRGKVVAALGERSVCVPRRTTCDIDDVGPADAHGTQVASVAAAKLEGRGMAGVAPRARIVSTRGLGEGRPFGRAMYRSFRFAVRHGASVINMSIGSKNYSIEDPGLPYGWGSLVDDKWFRRAVALAARRGVVLVASAANHSTPICEYPANFPGVMCVGGVNHLGVKASYSAFGVELDVVAPAGEFYDVQGGCAPGRNPTFDALASLHIIAATPNRDAIHCGQRGYTGVYGTSFAAPHVSGIAALLLSKGLSATEAVECIKRTATDLGSPGWDPIYGHGLVNAYRAVTRCRPSR